jgi:hypothetical protein
MTVDHGDTEKTPKIYQSKAREPAIIWVMYVNLLGYTPSNTTTVTIP